MDTIKHRSTIACTGSWLRSSLSSFPGWVSRPLSAMLADLEFIDCRSLDVLLVCEDDLAPRQAARPYEQS